MTGISTISLPDHLMKVLLVAIVLLSLSLRLYNLEGSLHFTGDEGRDALVVLDLLRGNSIPLLGPSSSVGSLSLGPVYYYLMTPFLWLSGLNPVGPAVMVALFSVATSIVLYAIGVKVFTSPRLGLLAAILYAVSPIATEYGRWSWNPNLLPFFAALFFFSVYQVFTKYQGRWLVVSALSLGVILQLHYLGLASIVFLACIAIWKRHDLSHVLKSKATVLFAFLVFFGLLSPLLIYDILRDFKNIRGFTEVASTTATSSLSYPERVPNILSISISDFLSLPTGILTWLVCVVLLLCLGLAARRNSGKWLSMWFITGLAFLGLYSGEIKTHYLEYLWPIFAVLLALVLEKAFTLNRWLGGGVSVVVIGYLLSNTAVFLSTPAIYTPQTIEKVAQTIQTQSDGKPFNLAVLSSANSDTSYKYFLLRDNARVSKTEATEQLFVICEGSSECDYHGHPDWNIAVFEAAYDGKTEIAADMSIDDYFRVLQVVPPTSR
jgi:4-amino-4-deoxy-L-arabinose transferase-like glycosyltransferase